MEAATYKVINRRYKHKYNPGYKLLGQKATSHITKKINAKINIVKDGRKSKGCI